MTTKLAQPPLVIGRFNGAFECLSNIPLRPVRFEDEVYPSKEHAFAAAKTLDSERRRRIAEQPTAAKAKPSRHAAAALGRNRPLPGHARPARR